MNLTELRSAVDTLKDEIRELSTVEDITPEQDARLDEAIAEHEARKAELDKAEARAAKVAAIEADTTTRTVAGNGLQVLRRIEVENVDPTTLGRSEARSQALKTIERDAKHLSSDQLDQVDRLLRTHNKNTDGHQIAQRLLATENDDYRAAFIKAIAGRESLWTDDERRAMQTYYRAASLTDAAGGYGVPVLIDPTIVLTAQGQVNHVRRVARVETITNDEWKGVSSAGVTWSFDAEGAAVSDDAPTLAQPTVTTYMARGFIPYSIEIGMDYPGFASEMTKLLAEGYSSLEAQAFVTGSTPVGIFTALDANTNVEVTPTTDGQFGAVDLLKVWKNLPEKYRPNAKWLMHVDVENEIRTFYTADNYSKTVTIREGSIGELYGKEVMISDFAPEFTGTTGASNLIVVGDFSNYLIAQRAGMNLEPVPHLFDVTTNTPTGQRGLFAWARVGADSINDNGFRLLQNQ